MPIVDVYIAPLPDKDPDGSILSKERNEEISGVTSERVRREKHFVWKLLTYALERSFGMHEKALEFTKEESGAWSVKGAFISLSHSSGALAVAVSRAAVGIDIELIEAPKSERMAERITTEMEYSEYTRIPEEERVAHLIGLWTAKEAIFKTKREKSFIPRDTDTHSASFKTDRITVNGKEYVFSVATDTPERIRIFKNIEL
jgi:phosphopantetheinyl transferase